MPISAANQQSRRLKPGMFLGDRLTTNRIAVAALFVLTAVALYCSYLLVAPFLKPIVFAFIVAVVLYPVHARLGHWIRNRNARAAISTGTVILLIGVFTFFVGHALLTGLDDIYSSLSGSDESRERLAVFVIRLFDRVIVWVGHYIPISAPNVEAALLSQVEKAVGSVLGATAGLVGKLSVLGLNAFIAVFVTFFLLRDGKSMQRRLAVTLPLQSGQARRLFSLVNQTLHAIVYGTMAMAALQGTLTGLAFWFLGLASPVVWSLVATVVAVLPIVGTPLVWLPGAGMLFATGHWVKAVILIAWGVGVVHPVDNLLRPYLIGGRLRLSTLYVFFAVIGGLKAFGMVGLFVGPVILSITAALLAFLREQKLARSQQLQFRPPLAKEQLA